MLRSAAYPKSPDWSLHAQRLALRLWLLATDAAALAGAYFIAYWVRFGLEVTVSPGVVPPPNFYLFVGLILIPVLLGVFASFRLYDTESLLGGVSEYSKIFNACTAGTMILVLATFVVPQLALSRVWVVAAWLL